VCEGRCRESGGLVAGGQESGARAVVIHAPCADRTQKPRVPQQRFEARMRMRDIVLSTAYAGSRYE